MAEFIADAAEKIAQNRVFADLTHGIVVSPDIEGAAEPEIRLYSFSPALFNDVQVQMPISSLLDDSRCGEPDRIPYDDAHMGMFGYIAKRIGESGRYTDITGMPALEIGSIAEEECMTRMAAGDIFESPDLNAAFSPYSSVSEIDDMPIGMVADHLLESEGTYYDADRNLLVAFFPDDNPFQSSVTVGHLDQRKVADAISSCKYASEGIANAYDLGTERFPFVGIVPDSASNLISAAVLSDPGFTDIGDLSPEEFLQLARRDEKELTNLEDCMAVGVGTRFNVLPKDAMAHIDLADSGTKVVLDNLRYPLMKGATFEDSQKIDLLLDVRGDLPIDEHRVTTLFDGREELAQANGLDSYAVSEKLGKQLDNALFELNVLGIKDGKAVSSWDVRAVNGPVPEGFTYSDAQKVFNMGADKLCVPKFREQVAEVLAKQRAAHSRLDALRDKRDEKQNDFESREGSRDATRSVEQIESRGDGR